MVGFGAAALNTALAQRGPWEMMDHWGFMWGFGLFGLLFWVAVFALIVVLIWKLVTGWGGGRGGGTPRRESPLEILQRRYARGEIDRDEYQKKRRDLQEG